MLIKDFKDQYGVSDSKFQRITKQILDENSELSRNDLIQRTGSNTHVIQRVDLYLEVLGVNEVTLDGEVVEEVQISSAITQTTIKPQFQGALTKRNVQSVDYTDLSTQAVEYVGEEALNLQGGIFETTREATKAAVVQGHIAGLVEGQQIASQLDITKLGKFLQNQGVGSNG